MSAQNQFMGGTLTTQSIVHLWSQAGYSATAISGLGASGTISTFSGALTADVLKTMLNISGVGGTISHLTIRTTDATSRTIRMKITADGYVCYDATSVAFTQSGAGAHITGYITTSNSVCLPPITWTSTLLIEIASNLTETDKFIVEWFYKTES